MNSNTNKSSNNVNLGVESQQRSTSEDSCFDSLLELEENYQSEGAALAAATAAEAGFEEGFELGWSSGAQLAAELAFYAGAAAALSRLDLPPRAKSAVDSLSSAAERVKLHVVGNTADVDFDEHLKLVREKFKLAVAVAGLHRVRFDAEKPSKLSDLTF